MLFFGVAICQAQTEKEVNIPTLTFSELMENYESYLGKIIRLKAIHIYGFEWSFLCDKSSCKRRDSDTWVEFIDEDDLCKGSIKKFKKGTDYFDNKAEIIYLGKLSSGTFGDGGYSYQFKVSCVEKFKPLKVKIK